MANLLTNNLVDYTKPASTILVDTVFGADAYKGLTVMSGVKYKEEIAILDSEITIQANGCNITPNTGATISPRYMIVSDETVEQEQCFITLTKKFLSEGSDLIPSITKSLIDNIQIAVEGDFWSGLVASGNTYNGVTYFVDNEADVVDAGWAGGAITPSNVDEAIALLIAKAPRGLRTKKAKVIFVSPNVYELYSSNRLAANIYADKAENFSEFEMAVLGKPSWSIRSVEGLDGYDLPFATTAENIIMGVDEKSAISSAQWKVDEYNKLSKFVAEWKIGAQVAIPGNIVKL